MSTKLDVYNALFEVTRRCNLCCEHCLRGDAENLDMTKETRNCIYLDGDFYVSAAGEICADCDLSYEMMKDYSITTIDALPQYIEELKGKDEDSADNVA